MPDKLGGAVDALIEAMRPFFGDDPVLAMYGTDHQEPLPELVDVVERANAENDACGSSSPRSARRSATGPPRHDLDG